MPDNKPATPEIVYTTPEEVVWVDALPNPNNERVRKRLIDEKAQLRSRFDSVDAVKVKRVGSVLNEGDLSNGGLGGDMGTSTVISERGVSEDAAQHQAADTAAARLADARTAAVDTNGWGKPVGSAQAAASNLLGDDAPPVGTAGVGGNPATAKAKGKTTADAKPGEFVAPVTDAT